MSGGRQDLEGLLEACRRGDEAAWQEVVRRHRALIYSVPIRWYSLTEADAAEIFQETCLSLLENLDAIRKPGSLASWLVSTAANHSRILIRRQRRDRRGLRYAEDLERARLLEGGLPQRAIEAAHVRAAVEELDPLCRRILEARYFRLPPTPYSEIARETGLSEGSVGPQRIRCLGRLLEILRKKTDEAF